MPIKMLLAIFFKWVDSMKLAGASIISIEIPELEEVRVMHSQTIAGEMAQCMSCWGFDEHKHDLGLDISPILTIARTWTNYNYLGAQRFRTRAIRSVKELFKIVDVIASPSTGCAAPLFPKEAQLHGESNLNILSKIMRFASLANFTGIPGVAIPFGYDATGLPTSVQVLGKWWSESRLLKLAYISEKLTPRRKPAVHFSVLQ